jgi:hypothetical protein
VDSRQNSFLSASTTHVLAVLLAWTSLRALGGSFFAFLGTPALVAVALYALSTLRVALIRRPYM